MKIKSSKNKKLSINFSVSSEYIGSYNIQRGGITNEDICIRINWKKMTNQLKSWKEIFVYINIYIYIIVEISAKKNNVDHVLHISWHYHMSPLANWSPGNSTLFDYTIFLSLALCIRIWIELLEFIFYEWSIGEIMVSPKFILLVYLKHSCINLRRENLIGCQKSRIGLE